MKIRIFFLLFTFLINMPLLANTTGEELSLVVTRAFAQVSSVYKAKKLISSGKWSEDRSTLLIYILDGSASEMYVFLKQDDSNYLPVKLNYLVNSEFNGKLGRNREYYDKYEQIPVLSQGWQDYLVGVSIITRAWKDGQRFTVKNKPVLIKKNGETLSP